MFLDKVGTTFQCCGYGLFIPDPGSEFFYPGSKSKISRIRIRIKVFKYFKPKKLFLSSRKNELGCSSRIQIFFHPGSQIRIQGRNTTTRVHQAARHAGALRLTPKYSLQVYRFRIIIVCLKTKYHFSVLRIRGCLSRIRNFLSRIQGKKYSGSRIRIRKVLKHF